MWQILTFLLLVKAFSETQSTESEQSVCSLFKSLGYSHVRIARALASCEHRAKRDVISENKPSRNLTNKDYFNFLFCSGNLAPSENNLQNITLHCDETSLPGGVTTVYPYKENVSKPVIVFCDQSTDRGGWTVIQNRDSAATRQDFNRSWSDYVEGFGDVEGEFWLGLDNIHALTKITSMELRIDLEDYDGVKKWAKYESFKIGDASTKYVLTLGNYYGVAGDALTYHNGMKFSTYDQDNDIHPTGNCALRNRGGWWFDSCHYSNLNGYQHVGKYSSSPTYDGIEWYHFRGTHYYSLKKASMKIRPK